MKITYEEPLDKEDIGLFITIAIIIFGCIIAMNFFSTSNSAAQKATTNLAFIPALLLIIVLIGVGYFNHLSAKKNLNQIISKYNSEPFNGFYQNDREVSISNYKPLREMPKNIAPYFVEEKK